ncbi:MAG: (4Fe-4S)-binding protein, partial [Deltaproteobacteria bacterium]|nr:(4Fe-4S)-binding protein [Deltaproteobacteria bacterium]
RVAQLAAHFRVPAMVCVNKFDLNPDQAQSIEDFAREKDVRVLGRIPFDPAFTKAMVKGKTIVEFSSDSDGCKAVERIWEGINQQLG